MANLSESPAWVNGVYQLETTDPVLGGPDGVDNLQAKQLANRTGFLKKQIDDAVSGALTVMYANKLKIPRSITMTGDGVWTTSFDGSGNATAAMSLSNSGATPGTYKSVTVDAKGRVTAGSNPTTLAGYGITDGVSTANYTAADVLNKIKTVDGAGSGLDADLLDGKDSTHFLDLANSTGTLPDARLTGTYTNISLKNGPDNALIKDGGNYVRTVTDLVQYRGPATVTGAIVFLAPAGLTTVMHTLHVLGFDYSATPKSLDFVVQGYRTTGTWSRQVLTHSGAHKPMIRLGRKVGTDQSAIIIGDVTDTWAYPHLSIVKALFSHTGAIDAYCSGWSSEVVTSLSGYDNLLTVTDASKLEWSQITNIPGTPAQFDNTTKIATTEYVQRALGSRSGATSVGRNTVLNATHAGKFIVLFDTDGIGGNITLPNPTSVPLGTSIEFLNGTGASSNYTLKTPSGLFVGNGSPVLAPNVSVVATRYNENWVLTGGSETSVLSSAGYTRLPSGLILQWKTAGAPNGNGYKISFPIAFPNAFLAGYVCEAGSGGNSQIACGTGAGTLDGLDVFAWNTSSPSTYPSIWTPRIFAIGY